MRLCPFGFQNPSFQATWIYCLVGLVSCQRQVWISKFITCSRCTPWTTGFAKIWTVWLQKSLPTHAKAMFSAFSVLVLHPRDIRPSMAGINDHFYLWKVVQTVETSESECSWEGCDYKRARRRPRPSTKPGSGILPVFTHGTECASISMSRYPYTYAMSNVGHSQLDQYLCTSLQGQYPTRSKTCNPRRPVYSDVFLRCRGHVS